ncbi:MAG: hypothetical protein AAGI91_12810 [Bacteroidota bacterium]
MPSRTTRSRPDLAESYEQRRQGAYERVEALGLKRRWIAQEIGRSVRCVTEVLRGTDTGGPTLVRIEMLLLGIERGEIDVPPEATTGRRADQPGADR